MVETLLAQVAPTRDIGSVLLWAGLLLVGVAVLVRVLQVFRRRFRADPEEKAFRFGTCMICGKCMSGAI